MASTDTPRRGEIWLVALGAVRSGEPGKTRPAIVVSVDELNPDAPTDLVVVVPLSSSITSSPLRVDVPSAAGIDRPSRAVPRAVRGVVRSRFERRIGRVEPETLAAIEAALALILGLDRRETAG